MLLVAVQHQARSILVDVTEIVLTVLHTTDIVMVDGTTVTVIIMDANEAEIKAEEDRINYEKT